MTILTRKIAKILFRNASVKKLAALWNVHTKEFYLKNNCSRD